MGRMLKRSSGLLVDLEIWRSARRSWSSFQQVVARRMHPNSSGLRERDSELQSWTDDGGGHTGDEASLFLP